VCHRLPSPRRAAAAVWLLLAAFAPAPAAAQATRPADTPSSTPARPLEQPPLVVRGRPNRVLLIVPQKVQAAEQLLAAITAQLSDVRTRVLVEKVPTLPATLAEQIRVARQIAARRATRSVFWFDLSRPGHLFVYLAEPGGGRVLVRTVTASAESERVEAAGMIVRGLARAVGEGGQIGVRPPPAPPPPPPASAPAPPPAPPPPRAWLALRAAYAGDFFASGATLLHGLELGALVHLGRGWSLHAAYRVLTTAAAGSDGMQLEVQRHPLELGARYLHAFGAFRAGGGAAFVLDYLTRDVHATAANVRLAPDDDHVSCALALAAHGAFALRRGLRLFVAAGVELVLDAHSYAVERGDEKLVPLDLFRVRPRFLAGLEVDLL